MSNETKDNFEKTFDHNVEKHFVLRKKLASLNENLDKTGRHISYLKREIQNFEQSLKENTAAMADYVKQIEDASKEDIDTLRNISDAFKNKFEAPDNVVNGNDSSVIDVKFIEFSRNLGCDTRIPWRVCNVLDQPHVSSDYVFVYRKDGIIEIMSSATHGERKYEQMRQDCQANLSNHD